VGVADLQIFLVEEKLLEEDKASEVACSNCDGLIEEGDRFCPHCGAIFEEGVVCAEHPSVAAQGICVICGTPCCEECGGESGVVFLCSVHRHYEIVEGMARVYGTTDNLQAHYVSSCLEQAGLHPFPYSRRYNPGPDVAPYIAYRQFGGFILEEIKVCVSFGEVLGAEEVVRGLLLGGVRSGKGAGA
jgi:hypothetical protein